MKLCELFEARKNPQQNKKELSNKDESLAYLSNLDNLSQYGITFTSTLKLGINPKTTYNTVAGIYFYPTDYYQSVKGQVPFAGQARYATIIKLSGNILNITSVTENEVNQQFSKLENNLPELCSIANKDYSSILQKYKEAKEKYIKSKYPGTALWQTIWQLSIALNGAKKKANIYTWNKILRDLGYDIVVDYGSGTIHPNEPTQGVALVPSSIKSVKSFEDTKNQSLPKNTLAKAPYNPNTSSASSRDIDMLSSGVGSLWELRNQSADFVNQVMTAASKASKSKQASKDVSRYYSKVIDYAAMSIIHNGYLKNINKSNIEILYKLASPAIRKKIDILKII